MLLFRSFLASSHNITLVFLLAGGFIFFALSCQVVNHTIMLSDNVQCMYVIQAVWKSIHQKSTNKTTSISNFVSSPPSLFIVMVVVEKVPTTRATEQFVYTYYSLLFLPLSQKAKELLALSVNCVTEQNTIVSPFPELNLPLFSPSKAKHC